MKPTYSEHEERYWLYMRMVSLVGIDATYILN